MVFPKSEDELQKIFIKGKLPGVGDFNGEQYYVNILTGIPSFRRFDHRKLFYKEGKTFLGNNQVLGFINFGYFKILKTLDEQLNVPVVVLNYDQPKTSFILNKMRDHIVEIKPKEIYLGRYYIKKKNRLVFKGYFSLRNCKKY